MIIPKWKCHNLLIIMSLFSRYSLKTILARKCSLWIKSLSLYKNLYSVFTNDRKRCIGQNVEIDFGEAVAQNHPFRGGNMQNNLRFFKQHRHLVFENGTYVTTNKRKLRRKLLVKKHILGSKHPTSITFQQIRKNESTFQTKLNPMKSVRRNISQRLI